MSPVPSQTPQPQQTEDALNGLRLAPLVDQHFWRWWTLFDSSLSLPIRQGGIFHSPPPAPKFGRTTATIKYRFDVAPFFVAHTYRQEAAVDWHLGQTTVLGGKVKFNSAKIDLHQRTEEFVLQRRELGSKRIYHKKFYRAQIHGDDVDARLIAARFLSPMKQLVAEETDWFDAGSASAEESGRETSWIDSIPSLSGEDRSQWENQDDFDDLGAEPLGEPDIIKIIPLMSSPACTYSMQPVDFVTSSKSQHSRPVPKGSVARSSKFGDELSHVCLVGNAPGLMANPCFCLF